MTQKETKIHMMSALRLAAEPKHKKPDLDIDVSNAVLASMELGVRSITWDMVKKKFVKDKTYSDLSSWITSGCQTVLEIKKLSPLCRVCSNVQ